MDFSLSNSSLLFSNKFTLINASIINLLDNDLKQDIKNIINTMGDHSATAQNLKTPITSYSKLLDSPGHRIYFTTTKKPPNPNSNSKTTTRITGMLKVGRKNLFASNDFGTHLQISPLCVLDFYVPDGVQRHGLGRKLFGRMLKAENEKPENFAYDRPSPKLVNFLNKHYGLNKKFGLNEMTTHQNNNNSTQNNHRLMTDQTITPVLQPKHNLRSSIDKSHQQFPSINMLLPEIPRTEPKICTNNFNTKSSLLPQIQDERYFFRKRGAIAPAAAGVSSKRGWIGDRDEIFGHGSSRRVGRRYGLGV